MNPYSPCWSLIFFIQGGELHQVGLKLVAYPPDISLGEFHRPLMGFPRKSPAKIPKGFRNRKLLSQEMLWNQVIVWREEGEFPAPTMDER